MENNFFRRFVRGIIRGITQIVFRAKYIGEQYPENGPYIVCPNHMSILDIVFVVMRSKTRWVYFMAKQELFNNALGKWFFTKMGAFPIKRGESDVGSIRRAITLLRAGNLVCIFPQGTRQQEGDILPPRRGVAMLAAFTNVPVIPIYIEKKAQLFKRTKVYVGKPIDTGLNRKSSKEEIAYKSQELMDKIYALPEVYRDK